MVRLSKKRGGE
jgi:hypothetical protein